MLGPFLVTKYKYVSNAIFQYVPITIIDQTTLNITADVIYYQSQSPYNQSFIKVIHSFLMTYILSSFSSVTKFDY
jgi:hypothetical protein